MPVSHSVKAWSKWRAPWCRHIPSPLRAWHDVLIPALSDNFSNENLTFQLLAAGHSWGLFSQTRVRPVKPLDLRQWLPVENTAKPWKPQWKPAPGNHNYLITGLLPRGSRQPYVGGCELAHAHARVWAGDACLAACHDRPRYAKTASPRTPRPPSCGIKGEVIHIQLPSVSAAKHSFSHSKR